MKKKEEKTVERKNKDGSHPPKIGLAKTRKKKKKKTVLFHLPLESFSSLEICLQNTLQYVLRFRVIIFVTASGLQHPTSLQAKLCCDHSIESYRTDIFSRVTVRFLSAFPNRNFILFVECVLVVLAFSKRSKMLNSSPQPSQMSPIDFNPFS